MQAVPPAVSVAAVAAVAAPDGRTIYVAGSDGRLAVLTDSGAAQLQLVDEFRADVPITCLALPSGASGDAHCIMSVLICRRSQAGNNCSPCFKYSMAPRRRLHSISMRGIDALCAGSGARALFAGTGSGSVRAYRLPLTAGQCQVRPMRRGHQGHAPAHHVADAEERQLGEPSTVIKLWNVAA